MAKVVENIDILVLMLSGKKDVMFVCRDSVGLVLDVIFVPDNPGKEEIEEMLEEMATMPRINHFTIQEIG